MSASSSAFAQIARPYANALFDLGKEGNSLGEIEQALDSVAALIDESEDFSGFLQNPVIGAEEKATAMGAIVAKAGLPEIASNFLNTIAANGRLFALPAIIAAFKAKTAAERGEMSAEVTSAEKLTAAQKKDLAKALKDKFGKDVALDTHVDPSLIGGLVVKVGSQMIDTSLKTKLTAMKIAMKEVG